MSYRSKKLNGSMQESKRRCRLQAKAEQPCKHPVAVSTGNETDDKSTNSHSSAGSQDLGEHGKFQHPPSGYKAAPGGIVSFAHAGGALAKRRVAAGGTERASARSGPKSSRRRHTTLNKQPKHDRKRLP